jgi:putative alpha-1,2-mannosidase
MSTDTIKPQTTITIKKQQATDHSTPNHNSIKSFPPCKYVDPFFGNGETDLPQAQGIAATWFFLKAQTGNTHPGAVLPFSLLSVVPYSGAYPTGYGLNPLNTHGKIEKLWENYQAESFSHFHHSGTGSAGTYYNYVRVTPSYNGLQQLGQSWTLIDENAQPGYYKANLKNSDITAELTVSEGAACHRYNFTRKTAPQIIVDLSAGGLCIPNSQTSPLESNVEILPDNSVQAYVNMAGFPFYIYIKGDFKTKSVSLWEDKKELGQTSLFYKDKAAEQKQFGVIFSATDNGCKNIFIGVSLKSLKNAKEQAELIASQGFEDTRLQAGEKWNNCLQKIEVEGGTEKQKNIFYSCLYHSLIKPAKLNDEKLYNKNDHFYSDFATMWDLYKTHLPLIFLLYPAIGSEIINSLLAHAETVGHFPIGILLNTDCSKFEKQARALTHYSITDALNYKIKGIDWQRALELMLHDLNRARNKDFFTKGLVQPFTHTLDLAGACFCTSQVAQQCDKQQIRAEILKHSDNWLNVYNKTTGLLGESTYYEGGAWNYSFRLLHNMAKRIALYQTKQDFITVLDTFFGFGQQPVKQPTDPQDTAYMEWGHSLNRFEGFNNEPDMETPYAYIYAGRHDRTAKIIRDGLTYMLNNGRGGLPGNNDSGGLSSTFIWNYLGIFPVTGQPIMLIGSPTFDNATIKIDKNKFIIKTINNSRDNIYVRQAKLNGIKLDRAWLHIEEVTAGGTLELKMSPAPNNWASETPPPSF